MFMKMCQCDRCGNRYPVAMECTTRISIKSHEGNRAYYDLCDSCRELLISFIEDFGKDPSETSTSTDEDR